MMTFIYCIQNFFISVTLNYLMLKFVVQIRNKVSEVEKTYRFHFTNI